MNEPLTAIATLLFTIAVLLFLENNDVLPISIPEMVYVPALVIGITGVGLLLDASDHERAIVALSALVCFFIGTAWPFPVR